MLSFKLIIKYLTKLLQIELEINTMKYVFLKLNLRKHFLKFHHFIVEFR